MPYIIKGKCVYKKNTGEKVGCTEGDPRAYLRALYMAESKSSKKNEKKEAKKDY